MDGCCSDMIGKFAFYDSCTMRIGEYHLYNSSKYGTVVREPFVPFVLEDS